MLIFIKLFKGIIMKNLHIQNTDKFVKPYIDFINKNFKPDEHQFAVICSDLELEFKSKYKNVKYFYNNTFRFLSLIKYMNQSQRIIIHSLFSSRILLLLLFQPWLLKRCYWVVWGGDLYGYRKPLKSRREKVNESLRAFIIKRFGHIVTLVKGDYDLAKRWYDVRGSYHHGAYINPVKKDYLDSLPTRIKNTQLVIQIGNSADPTNNHLHVLNKLKRFKDEDIIIYAPLSYSGSKLYVKEVIAEGEKIFGDKFFPLTEFLPPEKYGTYLNSIDIAIFNNDRQQALGNIYALLYLNKKVYIRSDTSMWPHFKEKFDIEIYDALTVDTMKFEQFKDYSNVQNEVKITKVFNDNYLVSIWEQIFKSKI